MEFALILPILLIILIGTSETVETFNVSRKVGQVASTVADLTAQAESVSAADLNDIYDAAEQIMAPYTAAPLTIVISSIEIDNDGDAEVDWSNSNKDGSAWSPGEEPPINIPEPILLPNTFLIVGHTEYTHVPILAGKLTSYFPRASEIDMADTFYLRPRLVQRVAGPS
ncbi:pilus assembly protein [Roseibium hamelinense]|uniref:pilus assembly protein n=1 Tax=Roseibium hamelinense TaxID=150831 RepID=UPI0012BC5281|nr:pilus assembly protein [Roseibium hamelinense]